MIGTMVAMSLLAGSSEYAVMRTSGMSLGQVARILAHRMMVMRGGEVVETGLADQVLDDPCHPYTQLLVSSILQA